MRFSLIFFVLLATAAWLRAGIHSDSLSTDSARLQLQFSGGQFILLTKHSGSPQGFTRHFNTHWLVMKSHANGFLGASWPGPELPGCKMQLLGTFAPESLSLIQQKAGVLGIYVGPYLQAEIALKDCPCLELEAVQVDGQTAIEVWVPGQCPIHSLSVHAN